MPLRETEAIILRSYPLGEADRLVSFLSRSMGRMRGVARGARRPKSRFGSTLEPLSHVRMWLFERETRELVRINQCELVESFFEAQSDYQSGVALGLVREIAEAVMPEREASDAMFRLVLVTARRVRESRSVALPLAYFALWTVRLAGWLAEPGRCARCGRALGEEPAFASPARAGLACGDCKLPGMRTLSALSLAAARRMLAERLEKLEDSAAPGGDLTGYLLDVIEHEIERKLAARGLLEPKP